MSKWKLPSVGKFQLFSRQQLSILPFYERILREICYLVCCGVGRFIKELKSLLINSYIKCFIIQSLWYKRIYFYGIRKFMNWLFSFIKMIIN